ncbi:MAG: tripartite tricarboxylate transporter substrate binding protein [Betaproteobacteria bacterium]|nr:tripartite tricarboxylate transporter substrate binding protein [Betaproteobacteria bacterium]
MSLQRIAAALAAACVLAADFANAQVGTYPSRPIRFVVTMQPGGGNDYLARLLAEHMQPGLGQPVVVENKPGAGGNIGTEFVARQPADGYTILLRTDSLVVNPNFYSKLSFDPVRDFEPITLIAITPLVLTVNSSTPVNSAKELIALARAKPGTLTYATPGVGTTQHLASELLKFMTGIDVVHVPYKGAAGVLAALLAGEVTTAITAVNSLLPHVRSGKLRPIAVAGAARLPQLPDVPTIAEAVPLPGYEIEMWFGVFAPAGTPRAIIERLNAEINRVVRDPQVIKERLNPIGLFAVGTTPERFKETIKVDRVKYAKIVKDANIRPE